MNFTKRLYGFFLWLAVFLFGVAIGQFTQYSASYAEYRDHKITQWSKGSDNRRNLAMNFQEQCLKGKVRSTNTLPRKPMTIEECANDIGAFEIVTILKNDQVFNAVAWPLVLLN